MRNRNWHMFKVPVLLAALLFMSLAFAASSPGMATYVVTVTNLTPGQPFTPPLVITHGRPLDLFTIGTAARMSVQAIAENGDLGPMLAALAANDKVSGFTATADGKAGPEPLVPNGNPGGTGFGSMAFFTVQAPRWAQYFSAISMLVCTNDGFTGVDSMRLPRKIGDSEILFSISYDAGTEINTEKFGDLVPPCQGLIGVTGDPGTGMSNPALAENGVVYPHGGIKGSGDLLQAVHDWTDPVARITVTRIK